MDTSHINAITLDSTSTNLAYNPITTTHNRRLINQIVDELFDERKGTCDVSSSQCSSLQMHSSDYSYDKRLQYWKDVLKDRQLLSDKIQREVSKSSTEVLYNRMTVTDDRDTQTLKRLLDYAERCNPENVSLRKKIALPEKHNYATCETTPEIYETLPIAERQENVMMEICGLPYITRRELLGKAYCQNSQKSNKWLESVHLERRIEEKRKDIERVIEFYPDIENLQVIGQGLWQSPELKHNSQIQLQRPLEHICEISSESKEDEKMYPTDTSLNDSEPCVEYGVKINDQSLFLSTKRTATSIQVEFQFTCKPFERIVKNQLMTIENIGLKVLNFSWSPRSYYKNNSLLLKSLDNEFLFNNEPFRLCHGEKRLLSILYRPRKVGIVKTKWVLKIDPAFFQRKIDGIEIFLVGVCEPHPEYKRKLFKSQFDVIGKSNRKMMHKLTTDLAVAIPKLQPVEVACPYQRTLNELELFEQLNQGFTCKRYQDLELLKNLYGRVKKSRAMIWDFKIDSVKEAVLKISEPETRALYFSELSSIIDSLKGNCLELEQRILENFEKIKARRFYVRGIICTSIDEWQELVLSLEQAYLNVCSPTFKDKLNESHSQTITGNGDEEASNVSNTGLDEDSRRSYILTKHIKHLKAFRDSLYVQTYALLGNFIENIVSVIESTEVI